MYRNSVLIVGTARAASDATTQLRDDDVDTHQARDAAEALERLRADAVDLVVIGEARPESRQNLCLAIRTLRGALPILLLGADENEREAIGQPAGADDYVVHERDAAEIRARVRALLRRSATGAARRRFDARIDCGPLRLHPATHRVSFEDRSEQLTATEYQLLSHLALSPERTFSRDELLRTVWGYGHAGYSHTLTTHVNRLREKLERRLGAPRVIETVRGRGYRFADPAERS